MRCVKCQGCVVIDGGERRCLNCGNRPDLVLRVIAVEPEVEPTRCTYNKRCAEPRAAGRLMCHPHLQLCAERAKAYYARKRTQRVAAK